MSFAVMTKRVENNAPHRVSAASSSATWAIQLSRREEFEWNANQSRESRRACRLIPAGLDNFVTNCYLLRSSISTNYRVISVLHLCAPIAACSCVHDHAICRRAQVIRPANCSPINADNIEPSGKWSIREGPWSFCIATVSQSRPFLTMSFVHRYSGAWENRAKRNDESLSGKRWRSLVAAFVGWGGMLSSIWRTRLRLEMFICDLELEVIAKSEAGLWNYAKGRLLWFL